MPDTTCPVCLDVLGQPVVAPCGHAFCFGCTHRAMDPYSASACPLCRQPYSHLPQECPQLSAAVRCLRPDQSGQQPRTGDFLCGACEQLLWRPAVLTCGHAVCGACLPDRVDASMCCTVCQLPLRALPSTCKLLQEALEALFPAEMERRAQQPDRCQPEPSSEPDDGAVAAAGDSRTAREAADAAQDPDCPGAAHYGVGCDSCGVFPIHGRCWMCHECAKQHPDMGFDLCDDCFQAGRHLSGRFAQQHTADHVMRERPLRKTFMHIMRSQHPSLSAQHLLALMRLAVVPDDADDGVTDITDDLAMHLAQGTAPENLPQHQNQPDG